MNKSKLLVCAASLFTVVSFTAEAKLFKWVDSNGVTHYGETIPPEFANKEALQLENGRVEKRGDKHSKIKGKTELKDPVAEKARIEAERHDNSLLNSYSSEQEIDLARDRNLQQIEARASSYSTLYKSAQDHLADLHLESDKLAQQKRKIPVSLEEDIAEANSRIVKLQNDLDVNSKEMETVKARYAADKARYRELKGFAPQDNQNKQQGK